MLKACSYDYEWSVCPKYILSPPDSSFRSTSLGTRLHQITILHHSQ